MLWVKYDLDLSWCDYGQKNIKNLKSRFLIQTHLSAQISNFATLIDRKVKKSLEIMLMDKKIFAS